jgi:hypothetical protein
MLSKKILKLKSGANGAVQTCSDPDAPHHYFFQNKISRFFQTASNILST